MSVVDKVTILTLSGPQNLGRWVTLWTIILPTPVEFFWVEFTICPQCMFVRFGGVQSGLGGFRLVRRGGGVAIGSGSG